MLHESKEVDNIQLRVLAILIAFKFSERSISGDTDPVGQVDPLPFQRMIDGAENNGWFQTVAV